MKTVQSISLPPVEMANLLPTLKSLPRQEKLFVIQYLVAELAQQEQAYFTANMHYPVWSPLEAHGAAATLEQMLKAS